MVREDWGTLNCVVCGQGHHDLALELLRKARQKYEEERAEELAEEEEYDEDCRFATHCYVEKQYRVKIRRRADLLKQVY